uniref:Uncharacterized protein n=1 Tax=Romanomermis culicivorax TaxID=13658 RepID=A0A915KNX0_ROMCU
MQIKPRVSEEFAVAVELEFRPGHSSLAVPQSTSTDELDYHSRNRTTPDKSNRCRADRGEAGGLNRFGRRRRRLPLCHNCPNFVVEGYPPKIWSSAVGSCRNACRFLEILMEIGDKL